MVCYLSDIKLLPKPVFVDCQLNFYKQTFVKFEGKCTFRYRPIWQHFVWRDECSMNTVPCQYNMILHTEQQWLNQNIYQNNHSQKCHITLTLTGELWSFFCQDCIENYLHYNGHALYFPWFQHWITFLPIKLLQQTSQAQIQGSWSHIILQRIQTY